MQKQRRAETTCEASLRAALRAFGLRYRKNCRAEATFRRHADVVFARERVAVFVDGCFWHGCPRHHRVPKANQAWWAAKIERNRTRDADTSARLRDYGWRVIRVWEHADMMAAALRVARAVEARRDRHARRRQRRGL
jgi:DNA mismatch endonuclease (patch repair protein)